MSLLKLFGSLSLLFTLQAWADTEGYPASWWIEIPRDQASSWETLPQDAKQGEVILSKRTELGVFSNLGLSPFELEGEHYASIEGLWQMMKFPDPANAKDPRHKISGWPFTRDQVKAMHGFDCKNAGSAANKINKDNGINWMTYGDKRFNYADHAEGSAFHLKLIQKALRAKLSQNPMIWQLLLKTKGLKLVPDHSIAASSPRSFFYNELLMEIRDEKVEE